MAAAARARRGSLACLLLLALAACTARPATFAPPRPAATLAPAAVATPAAALRERLLRLPADQTEVRIGEPELNALLGALATDSGYDKPTIWLTPGRTYLSGRLPLLGQTRTIEAVLVPRASGGIVQIALEECWLDGRRIPALPRALLEDGANDALADLYWPVRIHDLTLEARALVISASARTAP